MFLVAFWLFLFLFRSLNLVRWLLICTMIPSLVRMRIVLSTVLLVISLRYLIVLNIFLNFMEKLLLLLIASISLASCKSVGVRVQGHSTILRNDTIRTTYEVSKPLDQPVNVDY